MDRVLQEYRRKMASGDGSMEQYLRILARSGYTINDALNERHRDMVEKHLSNCGKGCVDCSPLGYDKRTPTIETLRFMLDTGLAEKCLIVCPASRISVWKRRFEELAPEVETVALQGSASQKHRAIAGPGQVFITSYSFLTGFNGRTKEWSPIRLKWDVVVADEVHYIKNPKARRSEACYRLADRVNYRIALSSCPLNHLEDVWGICRFINHRIFGKKPYEFRKKYFELHMGAYPDFRPKPGAKKMILERFKEVCR